LAKRIENNPDLLAKSRIFVVKAHGSQKYGDKPYIDHLESVVEILKPYGIQAQILGYLHDVVEDTTIGLDDIREEFGDFITMAVSLLSDEPGKNRKQRKERTYKKLATVTADLELVLIVKVADRLANVRTCIDFDKKKLLKMYRDEQSVFRTSAYRPALCDELWSELDLLLNQNQS